MDSRHIVPSFLHREIDRKKEQFRNSIAVDLNKFKARRKRLSTSECLDTAANSKLVQGRDDEKEKLNVKVASNLNTGLREIVKDTIAPKAHSQKVFSLFCLTFLLKIFLNITFLLIKQLLWSFQTVLFLIRWEKINKSDWPRRVQLILNSKSKKIKIEDLNISLF